MRRPPSSAADLGQPERFSKLLHAIADGVAARLGRAGVGVGNPLIRFAERLASHQPLEVALRIGSGLGAVARLTQTARGRLDVALHGRFEQAADPRFEYRARFGLRIPCPVPKHKLPLAGRAIRMDGRPRQQTRTGLAIPCPNPEPHGPLSRRDQPRRPTTRRRQAVPLGPLRHASPGRPSVPVDRRQLTDDPRRMLLQRDQKLLPQRPLARL